MEEFVNWDEHIDVGNEELIIPRNLNEHGTCPILVHTLLIGLISIFRFNFHPDLMDGFAPGIDVHWRLAEHNFKRRTSIPPILYIVS